MTAPILVATDLSARDDRAIDRAAMMARARGAKLVICHAVRPGGALQGDPDRARRALIDALPDGLLDAQDVELATPEGYPPEQIAALADSVGAQAIVTGVARFNDLGDYFLGTSVDYIVRQSSVPVLVVKRRAHRPYARMVAGTDLSDNSVRALKFAGALFPDAAIRLVHGWTVPFAGWQKADHVAQESEDNARAALEQYLGSDAIDDQISRRIEPVLTQGSAERAVRDVVLDWDADLLVVGSQGHGAVHRAMLGSTAENLLGSAVCDTLVVPPPAG